MKKLQLLKTLLDLFWVFLIIALIGMIIFIPILLFSSKPIDIPITINGETISVVDLSSKIMLIFLFVSAFCFVYSIYLLRKLLVLFSKRQIFEDAPIILLDTIGKYFVLASLLTGIPAYIYNVMIRNKAEISFGGAFDSFLFTASLGLFFMVLSEVFKIAKHMKEENELTV